MGLNTYIVACNADPTCIIVAASKEEAEKMARAKANEDLDNCDTNWTAYEVNDYFSNEDESYFFGWIKGPGHNYLKFV